MNVLMSIKPKWLNKYLKEKETRQTRQMLQRAFADFDKLRAIKRMP